MFEEQIARLDRLGQAPCGSVEDDIAGLLAAVTAERAGRAPLMCMIIAPDQGETELPEEQQDERHDDDDGDPGDARDPQRG